MITNFAKSFFRRKWFANNLSMMRGYVFLRKSDRLSHLNKLKNALIDAKLEIDNCKINSSLFGAGTQDANSIIRDYLINRIASYTFNKKVLISIGRNNDAIVWPLPILWRDVINSQGGFVSEIKCAFLWQGYVLICWVHGAYCLGRKLIQGAVSTFSSHVDCGEPHVYFDGLTKKELPSEEVGQAYDVVSWYQEWPGRVKGLKFIGHSVKGSPPITKKNIRIQFVECIPALHGIIANMRLLIWGIFVLIFCFYEMVMGRWWHPLMLSAFVEAYIVKNSKSLALNYLFHNSRRDRPLWTYEAKKRGSEITYYFYSTNTDSFKSKGMYNLVPPYYRNMNWCHYLVWDKEQAEFVEKCNRYHQKTEIVGQIWFSDSTISLPKLPARTIAVFDVPVLRKSMYIVLGLPTEYYTPLVGINFLEDIHKTAVQHNWTMAWKGKRKKPLTQIRQTAKSYELACERLAAHPNILAIDPDIAAARLIEESALVISIPFTSTALVGKCLGKPSYYYDPSGTIEKDDRAAHGIPVISGREELQKLIEMEF